jgi:threonine synthase
MTRFVSTGGGAPPVELRTALFAGLAPDGGLYLPASLDPLPRAQLERLSGAALAVTATTVAQHLLRQSLPAERIAALVRAALDFPIPLVRLTERIAILELFHGPTLAFKDVGARFMARLVVALRQPDDPPLTVLTATSGDTGGAVADAFLGLEGIRVVVLYPEGQVSAVQERQFTTLGGNVLAVAVSGTFDDCQRLAKQAFADPPLREEVSLTSANSINVGRLLPQTFYYAHLWAQLDPALGAPIVAVPSGNVGNLTGGVLAKRLGIPMGLLVAATNANDVVPEYLRTGVFSPRPSVRTISSAMDVGDPANLARILALYDQDVAAIRRDVVGHAFDDDATRTVIRRVCDDHGYVLDPHSAVGLLGLEAELERWPGAIGVVLATAHPAKFREVVEPAIGRPVIVPERLAARLAREPVARRIRPRLAELRALLVER